MMAEVPSLRHPAAQRDRALSVGSVFGLVGGQLAWYAQLCAGYALASWPCFPKDVRSVAPVAGYAWTGLASRRFRGAAAMRGLSVLALILCGIAGCQNESDRTEMTWAKGLIAANCATCHEVPGVAAAQGRVGPSLAGIAHQQIIAGHFANTPDALTRWIEHPQQYLPGDAMPEMGLTHEQARSIATYLYSLE